MADIPTLKYDLDVSVDLLKAIDGGSPDPTSHQPCTKGGEGHMGGSQGQTFDYLCCLTASAIKKDTYD